jgi:NAD(P)-dependent dehydrogenase (short-subunit alcohol dehydrogenase family)
MGYAISIFGNKIAVVTGAASGIGQALARDLANQGADVVLADVQIDAANSVAAEICRSGGKASAHYLDVTDSDAVAGFVTRIAAKKGRLDYMFYNRERRHSTIRNEAPLAFEASTNA